MWLAPPAPFRCRNVHGSGKVTERCGNAPYTGTVAYHAQNMSSSAQKQRADPVLPCVYDDLEPALHWVQSELKEWINAPPEGCCLESCDPVLQWVILMQGPEACGGRSLYDGEVFR